MCIRDSFGAIQQNLVAIALMCVADLDQNSHNSENTSNEQRKGGENLTGPAWTSKWRQCCPDCCLESGLGFGPEYCPGICAERLPVAGVFDGSIRYLNCGFFRIAANDLYGDTILWRRSTVCEVFFSITSTRYTTKRPVFPNGHRTT